MTVSDVTMKKVFSVCEDCRSEGIEEFDLLVTNDTHKTCHACNRDVEVSNVPPRKDVEIEVVHKGFAGIFHFWGFVKKWTLKRFAHQSRHAK